MRQLLNYHFKSLFTPLKCLLCVVIFLLNGIISYYRYGTPSTSLIKNIVFIFYMPIDSQIDLLRCLLVTGSLIIIVGYFLDSEFNKRIIYTLLRAKSVKTYFKSLILAIWIFIGLILLAGYIVTIIVGSFVPLIKTSDFTSVFPFFYQTDKWLLIFHQFCLLVLFFILLSTLFLLLILITNNLSLSLLTLVTMLLASIWISFANIGMTSYIPLVYGLLIFKELSKYPLYFCYIGLICVLCLVTLITYKIFLIKYEKIFINKN